MGLWGFSAVLEFAFLKKELEFASCFFALSLLSLLLQKASNPFQHLLEKPHLKDRSIENSHQQLSKSIKINK